MNLIYLALHLAALVFMLGYVLKSWRNPPGGNGGWTPPPENPSPSDGGLTITSEWAAADFVTADSLPANAITSEKLRELETV